MWNTVTAFHVEHGHGTGNDRLLRNVLSHIVTVCFLLVVGTGVADALGQSFELLLADGGAALESGELDAAEEKLLHALSIDDGLAEANFLLARLFLQPERLDLDRAKKFNSRAIELDPSNPRYLALRLYRLHHFPSRLFPGLRTTQREDLARRILKLDPNNATAHYVLGEIALDDYRRARSSVSFPDLDNIDVSASRESFFNAAYLLDPVLDDGDDSEVVFQLANTGASGRIEYVVKDAEAEKRRSLAMDHLWKAADSNPGSVEVHHLMTQAVALQWDVGEAERLANLMVASAPESYETWLFRGVTDYRASRMAEAKEAFETAIATMPKERAAAFVDASLVISQLRLNSAGEDRWRNRDPFLLTQENERQLEHYFRLAYADLRFGQMFDDRPGWMTDPGEVIVRYGLPVAEAQSSTRFDKYLLLHYGSFYFKFMDLVKSGKLTFYSPKAGDASPNFTQIERAYDNDFTLVSNKIYRSVPERFVFDGNGRRSAFPVLTSMFLSDLGPEVVVAFGIPAGGDLSAIRSGIFLVDAAGDVVSEQIGYRADRSGTVAGAGARYDVLHTQLRVPAAGEMGLVVEFDDPGRELIGTQRTALRLPVHQAGPVLSDILLAYLIEESVGDDGAALQRGGYSIYPAPWGVYQVGQPVYVYFESYGLADSRSGMAEIKVEARLRSFDRGKDLPENLDKLFDGSQQDGVSVRYTGTAVPGRDARYIILDPGGLDRGTYVVGLRLTEAATGKSATAGRVIVLE